jgi:cellulose 1,4-beta-cellobiosidase
MKALVIQSLLAVVASQHPGTQLPEIHPPLTWQACTAGDGCMVQNGSVTLDANWRWAHNVGGLTDCYTGDSWNVKLCPDSYSCGANCELDGANYVEDFGVTAKNDSLR